MNNIGRPVTRRPRAAIACNACRQGKVRCDSEKPKCGRCSKDSLDCNYGQDGRKQRVNRYKVDVELRRRLIHLETKMTSPPQQAQDVLPDHSNRPRDGDDTAKDTSPAQSNGHVSIASVASINSNTESVADVLATKLFDQQPSSEIGYFGPSSNHSIFRSLTTEMIHQGYRVGANWHGQNKTEYNHMITSSSLTGKIPEHYQPTKTGFPEHRIGLQLISQFFDTMGAVLPYTSELVLMKTMHRIDATSDSETSLSSDLQALLNIVIAYSLSVIHEASSELYYSRALALLENKISQVTSLEALQASLLLASFQQNSRRAVSSWSTHALSVQISYQLGIHAPSTYDCLDIEERQFRARIWLAVVIQDRILGAALGRPNLIPVNLVQPDIVNLLGPISCIGYSGSTNLKEAAAYFRHFTSLHEIMGTAVDSIYFFNTASSKQMEMKDLIAKTFGLSRQMELWSNTSSPFKVPIKNIKSWSANATTETQRYNILLSIHYYRTVLLSNAPLLLAILEGAGHDKAQTSEILQDMAGVLLRRDFTAAKELSHLFTWILDVDPTFMQRNAIWWTCNYTVLTLALHLLGFWLLFIKNPSIFSTILCDSCEIRSLLQNALSTLKTIGGSSVMSLKAHDCMRRYFGFLSAMGYPTMGETPGDLGHLFPARVPSEPPGLTDSNLDEFLRSLDGEHVFVGGLLGSEIRTNTHGDMDML